MLETENALSVKSSRDFAHFPEFGIEDVGIGLRMGCCMGFDRRRILVFVANRKSKWNCRFRFR